MYIYKIQIFFIWISAKKQLIMPPKQDMSLWNLIYYMLQFLMEQNKAIHHDCGSERKVREEEIRTASTRGWWKLSASLLASRWHPPWMLASLCQTTSIISLLLWHWNKLRNYFFFNGKRKWLPCILCGKFGSVLCKYEKFMRLKWFISSFKKIGIGVTENLLITPATHCKVSGQ